MMLALLLDKNRFDMAFVNGLFALLSVVFFVCLIVALIKPSIFKIKTRLKAFLIFFVAMIVSAIIVGATVSDEEKARIAAENKANAKQKELAEQQREAKEKADDQEDALATKQLESEKQANNNEKELAELKKLMDSAHLTAASNIPPMKIKPIALALSDVSTGVEKSEMQSSQILDVYLKTQDAVWSDANILFMAASTAEKVLKELRAQNVKDLTNVRFHAKTTLVDQYNNKSQNKIFTLNYNYSEVLKLNVENTSLYQDYLKFAQFESNGRVGRDVFNAWCADDSNRKFSGSFCSQ